MPSHTPKDNSRKSGDARERREQRQREAEERKRVAAKRTPEEQLRRLRERGITGGREWNRLIALIDSGQGKIVPKGAKPDKLAETRSARKTGKKSKKGVKT